MAVFFFEGKGEYYLEVVQYTKLHHISKIVTWPQIFKKYECIDTPLQY